MVPTTYTQQTLQEMRKTLEKLQHQLAELPLLAGLQAGLTATAWQLEAQLTVLEGEAWLGSGLDPGEAPARSAKETLTAAAEPQIDQSGGLVQHLSGQDQPLVERLIEKVVDASPQLLYLVDIGQFSNVYVNRQIEDILGMTAAEVQRQGPQFFAERIHPADQATIQQHLERLLASQDGQVFEVEYRACHADGSWRWLQSREVVFERGAQGQPTHILGMAIDVSQHKQAELQLHNSRELLSQILDHLDGCCWLKRVGTGEPLYVSQGYERLFHRPRQEVYSDSLAWLEGVHPEDCDRIRQRLQAELEGQTFLDDEFRIVLPGGRVRWVWATSFPIYNDVGQIDRIVGLQWDVTERKQIETALRESEARFRSTSEQSTVGICHCSTQGHFLWVNPALCCLLGYTQAELLTLNCRDITHPADQPQIDALGLIDWLQQVASQTLEKRYIRKDGQIIWGQVTLSPVYDRSGQILYLTGIIQNISDQKQLETDLRASLQEKDLLLAEVHHRVKNNLQIISSLLELQANRVQDDGARDALLASQNRVIAMALIHETLYHSGNLARIDFGQYVRQLVASLARIYSAEANLTLCLSEEMALTLPSDLAISLGLIVNELVTNALKHGFAPQLPQTLTVGVSLLLPGWYCLMVSQAGDCLPPNFDLERSSSMGLKLVRLLVQRIQGHLKMERGHQTTFTIQFPLSPIRLPMARTERL